MKIKRLLSFFWKFLAAAAAVFALSQFCEKQTNGFRFYSLLSNLPNDPRWEVPPLGEAEQQQINALLDQPFTYLGSGGWCIAFLGQDQKTVLKFYKHTHLLPEALFQHFSFQNLLLKSSTLPQDTYYFQEFNFKSCRLLYERAKERTGLLYVHINKTQGLHKPVTLIDSIGIKHTLDLDKTEFVVQKRAHLLFSHIDELAKSNRIEDAKRAIDDLLDCLLTFYKLGMRDYDLSLRNNFGYTEDNAVTLDLSSFGPDESLKKPGEYRKGLIVKTQTLSRFLRKNHPDLHSYLEERLSQIAENG
jgi:hypothetical protein